jgi:hypothetical protein
MPPIDSDDVPTLREVSRTLRDFRDEFRLQMGMMVRKDVHTVEHQGLETRLARLENERETDKKDRSAMRNQYYFSVVGAALSLVVALVVAAVK